MKTLTLYLTSSLGTYIKKDGQKIVNPLDNANHFVDNLKKDIATKNKVLWFPDNLDDYSNNLLKFNLGCESFKLSGFTQLNFTLINQDNIKNIDKLIQNSEIIIFDGGSLPIQNDYLEKYHIASLLRNFTGLIIGQSAGSMNMATNVYVCPETEEEAYDETFIRWRQGLNLTDINLLPHYNKYHNHLLGNKHMIDDIVLVDNINNRIIFLNDGAYLRIKNGKTTIYGECYINEEKHIVPLCIHNQTKEYN